MIDDLPCVLSRWKIFFMYIISLDLPQHDDIDVLIILQMKRLKFREDQ